MHRYVPPQLPFEPLVTSLSLVGSSLRAGGDAWMTAEGFVRPDRMTAAILPGWPD